MCNNASEAPVRDFFNVLNTRKTIRKYTKEIPPIEAIKIIADAGRQAPCATNTQNWEFIAILDDKMKEKMAYCVEKKYDELAQKVNNDIDKSKFNDEFETYLKKQCLKTTFNGLELETFSWYKKMLGLV